MKKLRIIATFSFLFYGILIAEALHIRISSLPANTPVNADIYIAGNMNNWNPGNADFRLQKDGNFYYINLNVTGTINFKFTRGSWATVEGNASGQFLPNREYTVKGADDTLILSVLSWEDLGTGNSSAASNVKILSPNFWIPQMQRSRRIWIYLPEDYNQNTERYPVLYMHDGQNLFDNYTSFAGEWKVDEALNQIAKDGGQKAIVVGIDNGGDERRNEYGPWVNPQFGGGDGGAYMRFIVETLKPHIDSNYRTLAERKNTAIGGSSLGAHISLYGYLMYPHIFSKLMLFSPAYWFNKIEIFALADSAHTMGNPARIYHLVGELEGGQYVGDMLAMDVILKSKGHAGDGLQSRVIDNGRHNEALWSAHFAAAFQWLFPGSNTGSLPQIIARPLKIYPNPARDKIGWDIGQMSSTPDSFAILDMQGRVIRKGENHLTYDMPVAGLKPGRYFLLLWLKGDIYKGEFEKL